MVKKNSSKHKCGGKKVEPKINNNNENTGFYITGTLPELSLQHVNEYTEGKYENIMTL